MASITINIDNVLKKVDTFFDKIKDKEYLLRPLAIETIPNIKERVHINGEASDGGQIGTYSTGYMKVRDKNKRNNDTKVIVSLTRQLENDYQVIATPEGYGIGFNNKLNFDKAKWVEERKKKIIFNTSEDEKKYIRERLEELVHEANS